MKKGTLAIILILLLIPAALAVTKGQRQEYRSCTSDCRDVRTDVRDSCRADYKQCKESCEDRDCKITCARERISCMKQVNSNYRECRNICRDHLIPKCEFNGEIYQGSDEFENGCETCECRRNGKVRCKQDDFCHKDPEISEQSCTQAGGLFQGLCEGTHYRLFCSRQKYCICEGDDNYSCPSEYECLTDFKAPGNRVYNLQSWRDMLGKPLGEIGICVK